MKNEIIREEREETKIENINYNIEKENDIKCKNK